MGNCQAAEAATVVIQRPSGGAGWTVERIYWSVSAQEVMSANPGHYVASVTTVSAGPDGAPVRQLKLLRPDDTLHIGHVYRLVSFEDMLKEFAGKKYTKLGKLLAMQKAQQQQQQQLKKRRGGDGGGETKRKGKEEDKTGLAEAERQPQRRQQGEDATKRAERSGGGGGRQRQWRPALQSIAEVGS